MSIQQMRTALKERYYWGLGWCSKVDKMSDAQVIAIYKRMLQEGEIK